MAIISAMEVGGLFEVVCGQNQQSQAIALVQQHYEVPRYMVHVLLRRGVLEKYIGARKRYQLEALHQGLRGLVTDGHVDVNWSAWSDILDHSNAEGKDWNRAHYWKTRYHASYSDCRLVTKDMVELGFQREEVETVVLLELPDLAALVYHIRTTQPTATSIWDHLLEP